MIAPGAAHYLATAIMARAAAGLPLLLRETVLIRPLAAANRLTPAGPGGSALTRAASRAVARARPRR